MPRVLESLWVLPWGFETSLPLFLHSSSKLWTVSSKSSNLRYCNTKQGMCQYLPPDQGMMDLRFYVIVTKNSCTSGLDNHCNIKQYEAMFTKAQLCILFHDFNELALVLAVVCTLLCTHGKCYVLPLWPSLEDLPQLPRCPPSWLLPWNSCEHPNTLRQT